MAMFKLFTTGAQRFRGAMDQDSVQRDLCVLFVSVANPPAELPNKLQGS
jgi:hypothetical protein